MVSEEKSKRPPRGRKVESRPDLLEPERSSEGLASQDVSLQDGESLEPAPPWQAAIQSDSDDPDQQRHRCHDERRVRPRRSRRAQAEQERKAGKIGKCIDKQ